MPENIDTRSAIVKPEVDLSAPKPVVGDHERTDGEHAPVAKQKITAAQIKESFPAELEDLGELIAVHLEKSRKYDDKADQHRATAGRYLAQAKDLCDEGGFEAFREKVCPDLGRSRAYELLAIANNKKSVSELRASTRERVARHRANKTESVTVTDSKTDAATTEDATKSAEERKALYAAQKVDDGHNRHHGDSDNRHDGAGAPVEDLNSGADADTGTKVGIVPIANDKTGEPTERPPSWKEWTLEQRRRFVEGVELEELLDVLPVRLRRGLEGRLIRLHGLQRATDLTKLLKTALKSRSPADQIAALGRFNEALAKDKLNFEDVQVRVPK
jgi:hypothetical protein